MAELTVFDLHRFALHDGPGIRTTVFLKGCPLDCLWCHNPESKKRKPQLGFLEKNCTGCGRCLEVCEQGVHSIAEKTQTDTKNSRIDEIETTDREGCQAAENWQHRIHFAKCIQCGKCAVVCLNKALKIYGKQMTADEILETVLKDRDFYERSGGGLTVSGGEPMAQFEGLKELLKKAKEAGLHICFDTSGQAPEEHYKAIAEYVDVFLFDYKLTDTEEHKRYTGVDNRLILKNLDSLCRGGSQIFLRCPIIPGINDKEAHYKAIAELSQKYDSIAQVNLMTYHDMAKGKAAQIGAVYELTGKKTIETEQKRRIYEEVESYGCLRLKES